ncbi:Site-specific recombinase XerD [Pontibacter lucknowensis]|uniref:Site-specific recombinase XerD n=1 Tax=Pontibacter lucknowensis TaxID=1077936 RepID=A0A1N7BFH9_9BACT|nr:Site-specific recombinase XerD [Pontibacter lucknowensis]
MQTACTNVAGFRELYEKFRKKITVSGRGQSTLKNYSHHLVRVALHFNCLPTELDPDQLNDYLYLVKEEHNTPSNSYFKFTVYSLRYVFRMEGLKDKRIELPALRREGKLPVVLSKPEVKRLLSAPKLLKHRVLIATLYGCGLRCSEVCNLKLSDLDFDRRMLHVRQGKGGKDRYLPLSGHLVRGLEKYILSECPQQWLFNGQVQENEQGLRDRRYTTAGIQWVVREARKAAGIQKQLTPHTLRHTYATHLLEDGLDIVSIKDLLGHACIDTTMVYLHVAQSGRKKPFSPLDTLYC